MIVAIEKNVMSTTTTFKTNLNSVSNNCSSSLATLKEHITTCLQRWRQKHLSKKQHNKDHNQEADLEQEELHHRGKQFHCYCQQHNNSSRWFGGASGIKSFNSKFQKFISSQQQQNSCNKTRDFTTHSNKTGPRKYGRKVEIVAKLFSATLIAKPKTTTKKDCSQQTEERTYCYFEEQINIVNSSTTATLRNCSTSDEMTVTELTFLEIRDEHPDLDSEIRSILTARAQDGATISEIREDYRKLTGLTFPVYENVTEFLLTIPHVTAYCTEKGFRIFSIKPMEKTKHIHDMVMQQKPQPECIQKSTENRYYNGERHRTNNYQPYTWRHNTSRRLQHNTANTYIAPTVHRDSEQEQFIPTTNRNLSREDTEGCYENNCCYYQDNCNYLFNRICNRQNLPLSNQVAVIPQMEEPIPQTSQNPLPPPAALNVAMNNLNADIASYRNNINHLNNLFGIQQQEQAYQSNLNNIPSDLRRSSLNFFKNIMPRLSRSSSPTAKSCYTTNSAFTDSDYEAHLLDFLLLGDDFLLYMARMELRCKFKKNQRILQSGLCVSGQTVGASIKRVRDLSENRRSIIVNIGSVDIMQGRQLIQIEHDFRDLLLTMLKKGIRPILTTLAPLANYSHNHDIKRVLGRFNDFIKRVGKQMNLIVIDIWKCLVNDKGHILFDCFQNEPRNVTGTSESYLFWNKIGRQRVLQLIESNLEY